MTQKDPGTDFDPKHRILGAVIIVVLAVILVPLILSEREPPADGAPSSAAPSTGAGASEEVNKVVVTNLPMPAPTRSEPAAPPSVPPAAAATAPAPVVTTPSAPAQASEARVETSVAAPKKKAEPTKSAAVTASAPRSEPKISKGWVVQMGTFSNAANATRLEEKLRSHGHAVSAEKVALDSGKATRLRVGPFRDKAAALRMQERIQKEIGVPGVVLAYP